MFASSMRFVALAAVLALAVFTSNTDAAHRGLAWGTDNRWAKHIAKGNVNWYMHWQNAHVPQMPDHVDYVPMYWGPKYNKLWAGRKKYFKKKLPKFVLAFNEPDVKGQSDLSPKRAATLFMKELQPLRRKGVKVSSPQIVWNTKWMDEFLHHLRARGGDVDFMAIHYYGSWKNTKRFKHWIRTVRKKYHKSIWLTEYGVTESSGGSSKQINHFQKTITNWLDSKSYVKRVAWLGCFAVNNPPDHYASNRNAMLNSHGKMRSIGYSYVYSGGHAKRSDGDLVDDVVDEAEHQVGLTQATPGAKRHHMQHHRRVIGLQQAARDSLQNATETLASTINGFAASPEEIQEYLNHADEDDDEVDAPEDETDDDCDEICKLREELHKDQDLDAEENDDN